MTIIMAEKKCCGYEILRVKEIFFVTTDLIRISSQ